jgi:hypothetical protein
LLWQFIIKITDYIMQEFIVSTLEDENDGNHDAGDLSLREAISLSNEQEGADTITFDSNLSGGTIALTQTEPTPRGGGEFNDDFNITDSVNIVGLGANNLTIDGLDGGNGIFEITGENTNVNLEGLTIANGDHTRFFFNDPLPGGAINFDGANLTLKDSIIVGSDANLSGAIKNSGNASIINSTITDSSGTNDSVPGGVIYNTGTLDISNSTISDNRSRGIANSGTLEVNNSSVSDNFGGGVFNSNSATVTSSIIANNTSSDVTFTTVTPGSNTDDDVVGTEAFTSGGNNLIGRVDAFGSFGFDTGNAAGFVNGENGDLVGTTDNPIDPNLGELQDNGGATQTQELLPGSPAIDTGSNPDGLATDQRSEGFDRTVGNRTDIGAFEVQDGDGGAIPDELVVSTLEDESDGDFSEGDLSLREAVANSNEEDTITFDSSLSGGTITLNSGELLIDKSLNIEGLGAENLTIDAGDAASVFNLNDGDAETKIDVSLEGLTITGGDFTEQNSGTAQGGIINRENLALSDSNVTDNDTGIYNLDASIIINNSHIDDNTSGSGLWNDGSKITINNSTINNNYGPDAGISAIDSELNIFNSSVSGNFGQFSGGILNTESSPEDSSITKIENSVISNNETSVLGSAGGISASNLSINNSTISNNFGEPANPFDPKGRSSIAGGIVSDTANISNSTISGNKGVGYGISVSNGTITNSIVAGNVSDDGKNTNDLKGEFTSGGNNLIGDRGNLESFADGVNGDIVGTTDNPIDPNLGELQDNGGATQTQELLPGSPAIDTGSNPDGLATDQRGEGFARTAGNGTDIGAFEVQNIDTNPGGGGGKPDPSTMPTSGDDTLLGTPCNDNIDGLEGNDILIGCNGNDTLYGGLGHDSLQGDDGQDTFVLASGFGTDTIVDFDCSNDLLGLSCEISFADLSFSGNNIILGTETIATLNGFDTANLTESNFVEV